MIRKTLFSALALCAVIVATSDSRGDETKALTAEQVEGKTAFDAMVKDSLKEVKDRCGYDLVLKTDFQNYDKQKWIESMGSYYRKPPSDFSPEEKMARLAIGANCATLIHAIASQCPNPAEEESERRPGRPSKERPGSRPAPAPKPAAATPMKELACLFAGYQAGTKQDNSDDVTMLNMSLKDGVFTLHDHPRLANIESNAGELFRSGGAKPDRPKNDGVACGTKNDCKSSFCSKGVCKACKTDAQCGGDRYCSGGRCWTPSAPSEPSDPEPSSGGGGGGRSKPKGLERGRMCSKGSECQSGSCKMENKTRGRCQ